MVFGSSLGIVMLFRLEPAVFFNPPLGILGRPENASNKKNFIEMQVCGFEAKDHTAEEF